MHLVMASQSRNSVPLFRRHALQRLHSPSRGISALVHLAGLSSFAASYKFILDNPTFASDSYGWHFQYLTIIGLSLATLTFGFGFAADITLSHRLFFVKNVMMVCSAPLEVLISLLYWGLRLIDKRLVLPEWTVLTVPADIGFHAIPAIVLAFDLLLLSPPWTISTLPAMGLSTAIAFGYWFWVELCFQQNGWYPYPIFEQLSTPWRVALFQFSAAMMCLNTVALKLLYEKLNGKSTHALIPALRAAQNTAKHDNEDQNRMKMSFFS